MTLHDFADWLDRYRTAWVARDPTAAVALFSDGATYYETPMDSPLIGQGAIRQYWTEGAEQSQREVRFEATPIGLENGCGFAHWRASFRRAASSVFVEIDGILSAKFDETMRCVEFREWWHRREHASADSLQIAEEGAPKNRYVDSTQQLVVELSVRDLQRSLAFYATLGFHVERAEAKFAVVAWEEHQFFLSQDGLLLDALAAPIMNVRVMVPDVDRLWQRVIELGLPVAAPVGDRSYGLRDFTIVDPDGFGVRFATWLRTTDSRR